MSIVFSQWLTNKFNEVTYIDLSDMKIMNLVSSEIIEDFKKEHDLEIENVNELFK